MQKLNNEGPFLQEGARKRDDVTAELSLPLASKLASEKCNPFRARDVEVLCTAKGAVVASIAAWCSNV